jgi:5-methylcytosine-specific restriction endonuclease McrA
MFQITTYKSSSGSSKHTHTVHFEIYSPKTYASSVLLRDYLRENDEDYLQEIEMREKRINFSREYLTGILLKDGVLSCSYCPSTNLIIELEGMKVPNKIKATIDHVTALSKGGAMFNLNNIVVSCGTCNTNKANLDLEDFLDKQNQRNSNKLASL